MKSYEPSETELRDHLERIYASKAIKKNSLQALCLERIIANRKDRSKHSATALAEDIYHRFHKDVSPDHVYNYIHHVVKRLRNYYQQVPPTDFAIRILRYLVYFELPGPSEVKAVKQEMAKGLDSGLPRQIASVKTTRLKRFYSRPGPSFPLKCYSISVNGIQRDTVIYTCDTRVGLKQNADEVECQLASARLPNRSQRVHDYGRQLKQRLKDRGIRTVNNPLYRLVDVNWEGPLNLKFSDHRLNSYRFTDGLLEDELMDSLEQPTNHTLKDGTPLKIREELLPRIESLLDLESRFSAGGIGAVFAIARPYKREFGIPLQVRSQAVTDQRGTIAVIPRAFHQHITPHPAEISVRWTILREIAEEIFGVEEDPKAAIYDWYLRQDEFPLLSYFREHQGAYINQVVGFGLDALVGSYEIAVLVAMTDWWYAKLFDRDLQHWEYDEWFWLSSKDTQQITNLLLSDRLESDSVFHLTEGLLRLAEIAPSWVALPNIVRFLAYEI